MPKPYSMFCALFLKITLSGAKADVGWPPRSYDLTPLDYYLCGAVKDKYYADKPEAIDVFKDNIRETQLRTIDNLLKNWANLVGYYMASRGSYLNEIIFR